MPKRGVSWPLDAPPKLGLGHGSRRGSVRDPSSVRTSSSLFAGVRPLVEMHSRLNSCCRDVRQSCATGDLRNINAALCVAASSHRPPLMPVTLLPGEGLGAATPDNAPATTAGEPTGSQGRSAQSWTAAARGPKLRGCPLAPPRADDALGGTARDRADRGTGTGDGQVRWGGVRG